LQGPSAVVAFEAGGLVGWSIAALVPGANPPAGQIRVIVHPDHRRKGIGEVPAVPEGLRLAPLSEVDPRAVYPADEVAQRTKPGNAKIETRPYDDWLAGIWRSPATGLELSFAALDGDRVGRVHAGHR
jgi:GNAT superfamily N-acetyltransferase